MPEQQPVDNKKLQILQIISHILNLSANDNTNTITMQNHAAWDSLSHMRIIQRLESEFDCEFSMDEIIQMTSVGEIEALMQQK